MPRWTGRSRSCYLRSCVLDWEWAERELAVTALCPPESARSSLIFHVCLQQSKAVTHSLWPSCCSSQRWVLPQVPSHPTGLWPTDGVVAVEGRLLVAPALMLRPNSCAGSC